jgi:nitrile hydratase
VLGLPPTWYKSAPYRARAVREPRSVLTEFGVTLPAATEIRVWDSTSEVRYVVLRSSRRSSRRAGAIF